MIEEPANLTINEDAPRPSAAQMAAFEGVPTGFVCDAMEGMGALPTAIAPLGGPRVDGHRIIGPALVARNGPAGIVATLAAVSLAKPGDVIIVSVDGWQGCSASGDQVCGMSRNAGVAALVTDGPVRDLAGILETGLPVWCTGLNPNSPYGTAPGEVGGAAIVGGVRVATGDLIVADENGVVVVPFARIDDVAKRIERVKEVEGELEAKVRDGFRDALDIEAMLADGRAVRRG